jgi:hypothetical protein
VIDKDKGKFQFVKPLTTLEALFTSVTQKNSKNLKNNDKYLLTILKRRVTIASQTKEKRYVK